MAKVNIFLSWSGETSLRLAEAFESWIEQHFEVKAFHSNRDIEPGSNWNAEVRANLKTSELGLLFVLRENLNNPWLLFEAGALLRNQVETQKKETQKNEVQDKDFIPILFDIEPRDLTGPLMLYQALTFNSGNIWKIIERISDLHDLSVTKSSNSSKKLKASALPPSPTVEATLDRVLLKEKFVKVWPDLENAISKIKSEGKTKEEFHAFGSTRSNHYIFRRNCPPGDKYFLRAPGQ